MFWCQSPFCLFQLACEQASLGRNRPELLTHRHTHTQGDNNISARSADTKNRNGANLKALRAGGVINISSEILSGSIVVLVL